MAERLRQPEADGAATAAEPSAQQGSRPRVLVLGGGFAGVGAAQKLKHAAVDVVVVDKHDYHTFQPLLYQVASDLLEPSTVGHPLRDLFDEQANARVHQDRVTGVDLERREAQFERIAPISYDYLVLALGADVNFFGTEGSEQHAFPMYTLADAVRLKEHILRNWEAADRDPALVEDGILNVVIVGGGPTGVETAGGLAELYRELFVKDFPDIPQEQAQIVLVEAGPELFTMFSRDLRSYTKKALEKRGVEVRLGELVSSIEPTRVTLESGEVLKSHTLVWGAGLQANPVATSLGIELEKANRVAVGPDLSLPDHPEVFVVGDIAWITEGEGGEALPQLGSVAMQSGEHAGETISRRLEGKQSEPFSYHDKGTMATIGRGAAVIQMPGGRTMKGKTASLAWGAVHLALLSSGEDRARTLTDWVWTGFTHKRPGRITVRTQRNEEVLR
jgi:NADH:quinone reductase (non-electrogenic)